MNGELKLRGVAAWVEVVHTQHIESGQPLLLHRGQIGSVAMTCHDGARNVEFADHHGRAFRILPLRPEPLMFFPDALDFAVAYPS